MIPCQCQTTGHNLGCLNGLGGFYINGVKVLPAPPPIIAPTVTVTFHGSISLEPR